MVPRLAGSPTLKNSPLSGLTHLLETVTIFLYTKLIFYYVYILLSLKDRQLYTGFTGDLKARYKKHQLGFVKATQHRRPLTLIHYEAYRKELDARRREVYLKGGKGKSELKIQLAEALTELKYKNLY